MNALRWLMASVALGQITACATTTAAGPGLAPLDKLIAPKTEPADAIDREFVRGAVTKEGLKVGDVTVVPLGGTDLGDCKRVLPSQPEDVWVLFGSSHALRLSHTVDEVEVWAVTDDGRCVRQLDHSGLAESRRAPRLDGEFTTVPAKNADEPYSGFVDLGPRGLWLVDATGTGQGLGAHAERLKAAPKRLGDDYPGGTIHVLDPSRGLYLVKSDFVPVTAEPDPDNDQEEGPDWSAREVTWLWAPSSNALALLHAEMEAEGGQDIGNHRASCSRAEGISRGARAIRWYGGWLVVDDSKTTSWDFEGNDPCCGGAKNTTQQVRWTFVDLTGAETKLGEFSREVTSEPLEPCMEDGVVHRGGGAVGSAGR